MSLFIKIFCLYNHVKFWLFCTPPHYRTWWLRWELGIVTRSYWKVVTVSSAHSSGRAEWILWKQVEIFWSETLVAVDRLPLQWRHNGHDSISNHQPHDCLLNRYSDADQRKHQSSASLAFVRGIHWGPVNSLHKWPVTRKMFLFYDVIMQCDDIDGLVQDCSNSSALALELLQSCTKPSILCFT